MVAMDGAGAGNADPEGERAEGDRGERGDRGEFLHDVTGRPVWRLLLRGLGVFLPGWDPPSGALRVPGPGPARHAYGFGPPAFLDGGSGFGLRLPARPRG